jgi:hypothetical protein
VAFVFEHAVGLDSVVLVDNHVISTSKNIAPIIAEFHSGKTTFRIAVLADESTLGDVPESGSTVSRGRNEMIASKLNSVDGTAMACKSLEKLSSMSVPNADGEILATRDDVVGIKANVEDAASVT